MKEPIFRIFPNGIFRNGVHPSSLSQVGFYLYITMLLNKYFQSHIFRAIFIGASIQSISLKNCHAWPFSVEMLLMQFQLLIKFASK